MEPDYGSRGSRCWTQVVQDRLQEMEAVGQSPATVFCSVERDDGSQVDDGGHLSRQTVRTSWSTSLLSTCCEIFTISTMIDTLADFSTVESRPLHGRVGVDRQSQARRKLHRTRWSPESTRQLNPVPTQVSSVSLWRTPVSAGLLTPKADAMQELQRQSSGRSRYASPP